MSDPDKALMRVIDAMLPILTGAVRGTVTNLLDDAEARGRAEGVAAERARVVAWLRAADSETLVWFAAQRIEQGWHDKEGE